MKQEQQATATTRNTAVGEIKVRRYIFHMEDGRQVCVEEYVGTEPEAMREGENRLCEHERCGGETPVSIEVQSQGKPNAEHDTRQQQNNQKGQIP